MNPIIVYFISLKAMEPNMFLLFSTIGNIRWVAHRYIETVNRTWCPWHKQVKQGHFSTCVIISVLEIRRIKIITPIEKNHTSLLLGNWDYLNS